jgi:hypothetical protein
MSTETMVREYKSIDDYRADAQKLARNGWNVKSVETIDPRSGCMRIILLGGIGALVFRPKPRIVVTYERPLVPRSERR